jgi:hypothetical protein
MFHDAQAVLSSALAALEEGNSNTETECIRDAIKWLNKWPLAHNVEHKRGGTTAKDFMLHYGVIGSEGKLDSLPAPGLARALRKVVGERFESLAYSGHTRSSLGKLLLRLGGWFYLAMPEECVNHVRSQLKAAKSNILLLSDVDLHAIGLGIAAPEDLHRFFPLVVEALRHPEAKPNNWLRAVRNICRFRNHALRLDVLSDAQSLQLVELLLAMMRTEAAAGNFEKKFNNCLEAFPFLLKRRRYSPDFLAPDSRLAKEVIQFFSRLDREHQSQLAIKFKKVPRATLNFLRMEATATDLADLLGVEDDDD